MAKTPRYQQIARHYRDRIVSGDMPAGAKFPTMRDMIAIHGISRATADKVMELLRAEGLAVSTPRAGTFVADLSGHATSMDDRKSSLRSTGRALGKDETSRILRTEMIPCPDHIALMLGVEAGDQVLTRERVTAKNGTAIAISRSYYTAEVADLTPELAVPQSIPSGSSELAAERMGSEQDQALQYVTARMATEEEMELLGIGKVPVTQVARIVTVKDGRIVEAAVKVTEGSRPVRFRSDLSLR